MSVADGLEQRRGLANRRALRFVGLDKPSVKSERVAGRGEKEAAVEHRRHVIDAKPHPLDHRRQVPGVDELAAHRGLATDRVEPGAVGPGRGERMAGHRRIEAGDRADGALEARGERLPLGGSLDDITHQHSTAAPRSRCLRGRADLFLPSRQRETGGDDYRIGTTRASAMFWY
jgi:hypothetical protein